MRRGEIVGQAINLARDLANTPPSEKCPARLAEQIRTMASDAGLAVQVWDETRIRQERFGGLLGVAAGSANPPSFVILDHRRGGDAPPLALVGKGVTFDSGGLSLKPSASMEDMKSDMTGAAVVAATMQAAARLDLPINVTGYLALTENMTGGNAMKLGDVLTMRNGKTVEVLNTDAEGRLILADALSFAAENRPARILDLATLTGACMVALGPKVAGLFSNDEDFGASLLSACRQTGERAWRLPLDDDYKEQLKSGVADLKNVGGKWGGAITAAKFLEQFVDGKPWIHLDIAGPSWSDSENTTRDAGGTGCFVRTLVNLLESSAGLSRSGKRRFRIAHADLRGSKSQRSRQELTSSAVEDGDDLLHLLLGVDVDRPADDVQILLQDLQVDRESGQAGWSRETSAEGGRSPPPGARARRSCPAGAPASGAGETHSSARGSRAGSRDRPGLSLPSHSEST